LVKMDTICFSRVWSSSASHNRMAASNGTVHLAMVGYGLDAVADPHLLVSALFSRRVHVRIFIGQCTKSGCATITSLPSPLLSPIGSQHNALSAPIKMPRTTRRRLKLNGRRIGRIADDGVFPQSHRSRGAARRGNMPRSSAIKPTSTNASQHEVTNANSDP
jgi:hypothetical protein